MASAAPVAADVPFLNLPVDCTLGETCVIAAYPDTEPSSTASDYRCGPKSRDGQSGTDFSLLSFEQMNAGVNVLAAGHGTVTAVRNTMPDDAFVEGAELAGQDCGNAVRVDHGNGYQTIYCHLKQGTIFVAPGDVVRSGAVLGQVGLSGRTSAPHLHLKVTQGENVIDPFAPDRANACQVPDATLWIDPPSYSVMGLFAAGISNSVPDMEAVRSDEARLASLAPGDALVLYGYAFHGDAGDQLRLEMTGPHGPVFDHTAVLEAAQDELFRAFGRRAPSGGWPSGEYRGTVTLLRNERIHAVQHTNAIVE